VHDEPLPPRPALRRRLRLPLRRLVSVPAMPGALLLAVAAAPLWLPLCALVDLVRPRRGAALRCGVFAVFFLACESAGLAAAGAVWALEAGGRRDPARYRERNFRLQRWWAGTLFGGAQRIFGLRLRVEPGGEPPTRGPILLLLRHASLADTLLGAALLTVPHGVRLRYVLKRELLWDPCLDVVGHRLPNAFVDRSGADAKREIRAVAALADGLGPDDGVLIYPEGTRFTPARRERAIARLRERGDVAAAERAAGLRHLLPPRPGGATALLRRAAAAGDAHVVVCGHSGLEGATSLRDLWRGALVGREIRVRCWTTPASALPRGDEGCFRWLLDAWGRMDAWLDAARR